MESARTRRQLLLHHLAGLQTRNIGTSNGRSGQICRMRPLLCLSMALLATAAQVPETIDLNATLPSIVSAGVEIKVGFVTNAPSSFLTAHPLVSVYLYSTVSNWPICTYCVANGQSRTAL